MSTHTHLAAANAADDDYFLQASVMANGDYNLAQTTLPTAGARRITITHTSSNDYYSVADFPLGTITIVGKALSGQTISEVITPIADDVATSTKWFVSLDSATLAGWAGSGEPDEIEIGYAADICVIDGVGRLFAVVVNTTANGTIVLADAKGTIGSIKASVAEQSFGYDLDVTGYLTVDLNAGSDVTIVHSESLPTQYAMS